jgi:hypothetical protein
MQNPFHFTILEACIFLVMNLYFFWTEQVAFDKWVDECANFTPAYLNSDQPCAGLLGHRRQATQFLSLGILHTEI